MRRAVSDTYGSALRADLPHTDFRGRRSAAPFLRCWAGAAEVIRRERNSIDGMGDLLPANDTAFEQEAVLLNDDVRADLVNGPCASYFGRLRTRSAIGKSGLYGRVTRH
jgi:hypothetical protein